MKAPSPAWGRRFDGRQLAAAYQAGSLWLGHHAARVDALNVFPVPDGDTGTNMRLTLEAAVAAVDEQQSDHAGEVARIAAQAALLGARGNSGVILSQILAGVAAGIGDQATIDIAAIVCAADKAVQYAYKAVSEPVEGTLLTAAKEVAVAVQAAAQRHEEVIPTLHAAVEAAHRAVARTPDLLPRLREAGVVDAGAEGLAVVLDGILRLANGEPLQVGGTPALVRPSAVAVSDAAHVLDDHGYCTNFLIRAVIGSADELRSAIMALGTSVVVAAAGDLLKVHVHTERPGAALEIGARLGELAAIDIANMRDQVETIRRDYPPVPATPPDARDAPRLPSDAALITVAPSPEIAAIFGGFGAGVIPGGQTMNPSVGELLTAIQAINARHVFVLPNNANILLAAQEAAHLSKRAVSIIPTTSIPQGIAAAVAYLADRPAAENEQAMVAAARTVTTIEVTAAARETTLDGQMIAAGQAIAVVDGVLTATGRDAEAAALAAVVQAFSADHSLITTYVGAVVAEDARRLQGDLAAHLPAAQLEVVQGGQPHYPYILALE